MKKLRIKLKTRHVLQGYVFVLPFIIGSAIFFIFPLIVSIQLSFGEVVRMQGFKIGFIGLENYIRAFIVDVKFMPMFIQVVTDTTVRAPLTIIFSLLLAIMINKSLKFRGLFRTVYFIPFLLGTGEVMKFLLNQGVDQQIMSLNSSLISTELLSYFGENVVKAVNTVFGVIVQVLWGCGAQMLLFLSGLQSIPNSLYEAARVDGTNEWESFWKITMPMIAPIMLLNVIYTINASFINSSNPILAYIQEQAFKNTEFGYAAAMGWIYFVFILLLIVAVTLLMKSYVDFGDVKEGSKHARRV